MSAEALFKKRKTRSQKLAYIATHQKKRKIIETYHLNDFFMLHCLPQAPIL